MFEINLALVFGGNLCLFGLPDPHLLDRSELCRLLAPHLTTRILPVHKKVLATLWLLGNQESFRGVGDRFDLSKSSLHKVLLESFKVILSTVTLLLKHSTGNATNEGFSLKNVASKPLPRRARSSVTRVKGIAGLWRSAGPAPPDAFSALHRPVRTLAALRPLTPYCVPSGHGILRGPATPVPSRVLSTASRAFARPPAPQRGFPRPLSKNPTPLPAVG
ncbi:hypothetical protein GWK47_037584 [Chionoecetes opilio]|uniref:Uncharacterized protein n=1 Tax=Chionoecetes opilio TaxID=41210 RepID=A0A8J4YLP7_CHIOP|nr:hypothetical protein GWK47_037584 [Chionoecetes opilio]